MLKSYLQTEGKITHVQIGDTMLPIENISDDLFMYAVCCCDALIQSWEKPDRIRIHERYFYIGNINKLKIKREKTCALVNNIFLLRKSKFYPLEKKYGYISYAVGYVKYAWYWIFETIQKKIEYMDS